MLKLTRQQKLALREVFRRDWKRPSVDCPDCGGDGVTVHNERETVSRDGWTVKPMYKIIRFSSDGLNRTMFRGLTLEQAQFHCQDSQTSSRTCRTPKGTRTKAMIANHERRPWFHGYAEE
jgi:hypothetical protein